MVEQQKHHLQPDDHQVGPLADPIVMDAQKSAKGGKGERRSSSETGEASKACSPGGTLNSLPTAHFWTKPNKPSEPPQVPLIMFRRAMVRLFRILQQPYPETDGTEQNITGKVGWYEFCSFWKEQKITIKLTLRERIFLTLEDAERSIAGRFMSVLVFLAILVSTACFILGTMPSLQSKCDLEGHWNHDPNCKPTSTDFFLLVDLVCVLFFTIEYGARLALSGFTRAELAEKDKQQLLEWMVTEDTLKIPDFRRRCIQWFFLPANLIDLAAICPWYLSKVFESAGSGDNFVIRLIRLTRVIRAIRLGKKFEAVIIVARSVRRSLRALNVLVLNLLLGVIIFGSLMYFCEGGKWDVEKKAHLRWEGLEFNPDTREWEDVHARTPFESIPACFWWAIVTATTAGYGDTFPTTPYGKAIAGVTMIWSLCVLALPIGVIGSNFSQVWEEFDKQKTKEHWNTINKDMMLKRSIAWGDPLYYSRRILLEVWHDPGLNKRGKIGDNDERMQAELEMFESEGVVSDQAEFMGEVDCTIEMTADEECHRRVTLPLTSNYDKARRQVRGDITFDYVWKPNHKSAAEDDALLTGELQVTVVSADDLISIDWKGSCASDPYCVVVGYPQSPPENGRVDAVWHRSHTAWDTSTPAWDYKCKFDVHWTQAGHESCLQADMRQIGSGTTTESPIASAPARRSSSVIRCDSRATGLSEELSEEEKYHEMTKIVPELQESLSQLCWSQRHLKSQISDVKQDLDEIVSTLRMRGGGPTNDNIGSVVYSQQGSAASSSKQASPKLSSNASPWVQAQ